MSFVPCRAMAHALGVYVSRRELFSSARRYEIARTLAEPLVARFGLPADTNPDLLLCALYLPHVHRRSGRPGNCPRGRATPLRWPMRRWRSDESRAAAGPPPHRLARTGNDVPGTGAGARQKARRRRRAAICQRLSQRVCRPGIGRRLSAPSAHRAVSARPGGPRPQPALSQPSVPLARLGHGTAGRRTPAALGRSYAVARVCHLLGHLLRLAGARLCVTRVLRASRRRRRIGVA